MEGDRITRWHPKFLVDQVPVIEVAELPQPPEINRIYTAKAALEEARNMLTPRVSDTMEGLKQLSSTPSRRIIINSLTT